MAPSLHSSPAIEKAQRTGKNGGEREMKIRRAGQVKRVAFAAFSFALLLLACGAAMASEVERQIPVIRDSAGSGLTIEITREGTRETATPFLTLNDPTVRRVEDRIAKKATQLQEKEIPGGTPRKESGQPQTTLSSLPLVPGEITIKSVKGFLKGLRSSRKEKPAPAVAAPARELRLGMAASSPRQSN